MLSELRLQNFKTARDLDLPLAPLTLFAGLNGSGKSTVLQSLAAVRQSLLGSRATGLQLCGPLVSLGRGGDVLSEGAREEFIDVDWIENGSRCHWKCKVAPDAIELQFLEQPKPYDGFAVSPHFQYLQADRIVPRTTYPQADQQARELGFLGSHGEFTADFLMREGGKAVPESRHALRDVSDVDILLWGKIAPTPRLYDQVCGWLQVISPGARIRAEALKGTDELILQFQYVGQARGLESRFYRPTNVGFGLTYSLPIIVACLAAVPGTLLLIENPEAHLHPQGQARLGELIALCAADGVQILVETHSDHILNGVRLAVKKKRIRCDDVQLCYFTRDTNSGDSYVEHPSILPNGQLTNWPNGFFDQWEKSLDALLE